ncbi:phosphotransacetylase [Mycoplasmopsis caviae]|uniref:Phosphate acetyltransferase n=1 Tax=Mycoplasmopsis caviae TaxID=55603 RepID=A0A3P8KBZ8_9BACT|nr:phosphotransacetylase [Mycoplasmopsis caviae]UUD35050.1 phosphotransacetylase [Mycoplasmopsis caviae]VDR42124.1 phosphate acetyltransferase [Mycoplasmopsis caviae]
MKFTSLIEKRVKAIKTTKRIIFVDGDDTRALEAVKQLEKFKNIEITLLTENDVNLQTSAKVIDINKDKQLQDQLAQKYFELRKGKESIEQAQKSLQSRPFYAMMLLATGQADGVVGGLNYSTADILRAAFKAIGSKEGIKTISSVMVLHNNKNTYFFSDISVNVKPDQSSLVEIGLNAAEFAQSMGYDPKLAFLSFSTNYSAKTPESELVHKATEEFNSIYNGTKAIGEIQLDAALDLEVRKAKYKLENYNEPANTLIFPDLGAGNIGYKLVQRLGGYGAIGPIVVGTKMPVNDLSRGSSVSDVVNTILITILQSVK